MSDIVLTIAGSDSGGGAGIQADLKTFSALGVYGASVITAVTAQNTKAVTAVHPVPVDIIARQIEAVLSDLDVKAIKIGMLATCDVIDVVADSLANFTGHIVLDPVMIAKSGDALLADDAVAHLLERLVPRASLLTPNLPEAAHLLRVPQADNEEQMQTQGNALLASGATAVLMKGGHGNADICTDILFHVEHSPLRLTAPRRDTVNTHGTGCTLSSAIAAGLGRGLDMADAVTQAHTYLQGAIKAADNLNIGSGHGPVHHFHELWDNG